MEFKTHDEEGYAVIDFIGDIDLSVAPGARRALLDPIGEGRSVLVDLSSTTYIDSSGIACLVEALQTSKKQGLRFGLIGVSEAAMNVLRLARLENVFPIHATITERVADDD